MRTTQDASTVVPPAGRTRRVIGVERPASASSQAPTCHICQLRPCTVFLDCPGRYYRSPACNECATPRLNEWDALGYTLAPKGTASMFGKTYSIGRVVGGPEHPVDPRCEPDDDAPWHPSADCPCALCTKANDAPLTTTPTVDDEDNATSDDAGRYHG